MTYKTLDRAIICIAALLLVSGCDLFVDDAERIERARAFSAQQEYRTAMIELRNVLRSDPDNIEARVLLGELSLTSGDSESAIKEFRRARELGASSDDYIVPMARSLLRENRFDEVIALSLASIADPAKKAEVLAIVGFAEKNTGNTTESLERFNAALALDPQQADALVGLATIAGENNKLDEATDYLQKLLSAHPDDARGLATKARMDFALGNYPDAEAGYQRALAASAGAGLIRERMMYQAGLIDVQLANGDNPGAQQTAKEMLEMTKEHPMALLQAARVDFANGDHDAVIEKTQRIVTTLPEYAPPRVLLAASAMAKQNNVLAARHLQSVVNVDPGNDQARKLLAQVRMNLGSPAEALEVLQPLLAKGTSDPQLMAMAGAASLRTGHKDAAVDFLDRGVAASGDDPVVLMQAASNFLAAGEIDRAISVLESLPETEQVGQQDLMLILALVRNNEVAAARAKAQAFVDASPDDGNAYRLLGGFHLAVDEKDQARAAFDKALALNPADNAATIALARLDVDAGEPEKAEQRFRKLLEREPGNRAAYISLARLAEQRGDSAAGVALLEQLAKQRPDDTDALLLLSRYYLRKGQLKLAEDRARQLLRIAPTLGDAHRLLGQIQLADGRNSEALASLEKAVETAPNAADAHYQLSNAQLKSGMEEDAMKSLRRSIELDPQHYPARAALATALARRGDSPKAMAIANELIAEFPARAEPLILKGDIETQRKDYPAALKIYEKAAAITPSRVLAARRADLNQKLGRENSLAPLQQWVTDNPDDYTARMMLGQGYVILNDPVKAISEFETVMSAQPGANVATRLGLAYEQAGDSDAAVKWLDEALKLEPDSIDALGRLAKIEVKRGNGQRAREAAGRLRQKHPQLAEAAELEGDVLVALDDYSGAVNAFKRALVLKPSELLTRKHYDASFNNGNNDAWRILESWLADNPGDNGVRLQLAQHFDAQDLPDEAIETYQRVLDTDPVNYIALNNIAWAYHKRDAAGDKRRALNAASRAYELRKDLPPVVDTYGWILLADGKVDRALSLLANAAASLPDDPDINYHLAVAQHRSGDTAAARATLDKLLASSGAFDSRPDAEALRKQL